MATDKKAGRFSDRKKVYTFLIIKNSSVQNRTAAEQNYIAWSVLENCFLTDMSPNYQTCSRAVCVTLWSVRNGVQMVLGSTPSQAEFILIKERKEGMFQ